MPTDLPGPPIEVLRAARRWADDHGHQQPDDRMLDAVTPAVLRWAGDQIRAEAARLEERDGAGYSYAYGFADAADFIDPPPHLILPTTYASGDDTMSRPLDLDVISREWLRVCGACDYGMPAGCACPDGDPRSVISRLVAEIERLRAEPAVPRRVPTQAERIADAIADGHHRITEGGQTATDAMSDRYGETLDLIATAVETATDDTLRGSIRSMIRRVRPEAFDLWSAGQVDQAGMKSGMKSRPGSGMDLPRTQTDHCPATRQTGIAGMTETLTCNRGAGHDGQTHRDPVYGYWTHPATPADCGTTHTEETPS